MTDGKLPDDDQYPIPERIKKIMKEQEEEVEQFRKQDKGPG